MEDIQFEVVEIIEHRKTEGSEEVSYLVTWDDGSVSWVDAEDCDGCPLLVEEYLTKFPDGLPVYTYEVECVLNFRVNKCSGMSEYLIQWTNYEKPQWVQYIDLDCPEKISVFWNRRKSAGKSISWRAFKKDSYKA